MLSHESPDGVVALPGPGVPADHGLASLGLVMQLAARTSSALAALVASLVMLEPRLSRHAGWILFAAALCIARSQLHRLAGRELLYGRRTIDGDAVNPFHSMRTYIAFGTGHAPRRRPPPASPPRCRCGRSRSPSCSPRPGSGRCAPASR
jgi:hypothetical protein